MSTVNIPPQDTQNKPRTSVEETQSVPITPSSTELKTNNRAQSVINNCSEQPQEASPIQTKHTVTPQKTIGYSALLLVASYLLLHTTRGKQLSPNQKIQLPRQVFHKICSVK